MGKSFSLMVVLSLADEFLVKRKSSMPAFLQSFDQAHLKYCLGSGLKLLLKKHLSAIPILLILACYGKIDSGSYHSNDGWADMIERQAKFGKEMAAGLSFWCKVKQAYTLDQIQKKRKEQA